MIFGYSPIAILFAFAVDPQISELVFAGPITLDTSMILPIELKIKLQGNIRGKWVFSDKKNKHLLILTRDSTRYHDGTDKISIQANQYTLDGPNLVREWTINDMLTCKDLDIAVDFFPELTSITDLDSNGIAESSIAYRLSCSGDIEPELTKVIMRQGKKKYSVRGESLIRLSGIPPEGGTFRADSSLNSVPTIKKHLVSIWKRAAGILPLDRDN